MSGTDRTEGTPATPPSAPVPRINDADRERVIAVLRSACGDGTLTLDEFAERAGVVYASVTGAELEAVTRDLPAPAATTNPVPGGRVPSRYVVAIMSAARRRGRWRVAPVTTAVAYWGSVKLDLRGAVVEHPVIEIRAWAIMGGVEIVVPDGIPVELSGMVVMGGTTNRVKDMQVVPGAPLVRIKARGLWGGVHVRSRPMDERSRPDSRAIRGPGAIPAPGAMHAQRAIEHAQRHAERALKRAEEWVAFAEGVSPVYAERPADPEVESIVEDVQRSPVDLAGQMTDGTVTIMFSDIEGSTALASLLGDQRWLDVVREHNKLVREQLAMAGGREVKTQGDGFMVTFPGAARALRCAIDIQKALGSWRDTHPDAPVHVRIGVHTGEVIAEGGDVYGKHVMIAARITAQARGGEILASSLVRELADGSGIPFGAGRDVELRGLDRPWRLYPVDWTD